MADEAQIRREFTNLLDSHGRLFLTSPRMTQAEKVGFLYCLSILDYPTNPVRGGWAEHEALPILRDLVKERVKFIERRPRWR